MKFPVNAFLPCTKSQSCTPAGSFASWARIQPRRMMYGNFWSALRVAIFGTRLNKHLPPYSRWDYVWEALGNIALLVLIATFVLVGQFL